MFSDSSTRQFFCLQYWYTLWKYSSLPLWENKTWGNLHCIHTSTSTKSVALGLFETGSISEVVNHAKAHYWIVGLASRIRRLLVRLTIIYSRIVAWKGAENFTKATISDLWPSIMLSGDDQGLFLTNWVTGKKDLVKADNNMWVFHKLLLFSATLEESLFCIRS